MFSSNVFATETPETLDLDAKRDEVRKAFKGGKIPDPKKLMDLSEMVFVKPLGEQKMRDLKIIALQANQYANLVGFIENRYDDYNISNYGYGFVLKKSVPIRDQYVVLADKYKSIRDTAYFNIGMKLKANGKPMEALLYFKDSFRLEAFDCGKEKPKEKCLRWMAEQEMKSLLSIKTIESYVTWEE